MSSSEFTRLAVWFQHFELLPDPYLAAAMPAYVTALANCDPSKKKPQLTDFVLRPPPAPPEPAEVGKVWIASMKAVPK